MSKLHNRLVFGNAHTGNVHPADLCETARVNLLYGHTTWGRIAELLPPFAELIDSLAKVATRYVELAKQVIALAEQDSSRLVDSDPELRDALNEDLIKLVTAYNFGEAKRHH
ncbi:MAG: hypothetical protein WC553_00810 [Patescibacteria group bacterium]